MEAVKSERLIRDTVRLEAGTLIVGDQRLVLAEVERIVVVGAGKAGAGMAAAMEEVLGPQLAAAHQLSGWVNVPADCVRPLEHITLHAARPAGVNEPTEAGVQGARQILELIGSLGPRDVCFCLLSGGGSALLPAPVISLADKQAVTRQLSGAGANIDQLNTVRKQLSRIKGGGLARACGAGKLFALIISDVTGDPLDIIASGPTVPDGSTPAAALVVLKQFGSRAGGVPESVFEYLASKSDQLAPPPTCQVHNLIIGNNARAVTAAAARASELGYQVQASPAEQAEGQAEALGREIARRAVQLRASGGDQCLISGGEPVVTLPPTENRGRGGRNQQLVLAAAIELVQDSAPGMAILSGGTDGEDGPTDAAGALLTADVLAAGLAKQLDFAYFLARCDVYHFFEQLDALLQTGPTHTNVMDVRVVVTSSDAASG